MAICFSSGNMLDRIINHVKKCKDVYKETVGIPKRHICIFLCGQWLHFILSNMFPDQTDFRLMLDYSYYQYCLRSIRILKFYASSRKTRLHSGQILCKLINCNSNKPVYKLSISFFSVFNIVHFHCLWTKIIVLNLIQSQLNFAWTCTCTRVCRMQIFWI